MINFTPQSLLTRCAFSMAQANELPSIVTSLGISVLNAWGVVYYSIVSGYLCSRLFYSDITYYLPFLPSCTIERDGSRYLHTIHKCKNSFLMIFSPLTHKDKKEIITSLLNYKLILSKNDNRIWDLKFDMEEDKLAVAAKFLSDRVSKQNVDSSIWFYLREKLGNDQFKKIIISEQILTSISLIKETLLNASSILKKSLINHPQYITDIASYIASYPEFSTEELLSYLKICFKIADQETKESIIRQLIKNDLFKNNDLLKWMIKEQPNSLKHYLLNNKLEFRSTHLGSDYGHSLKILIIDLELKELWEFVKTDPELMNLLQTEKDDHYWIILSNGRIELLQQMLKEPYLQQSLNISLINNLPLCHLIDCADKKTGKTFLEFLVEKKPEILEGIIKKRKGIGSIFRALGNINSLEFTNKTKIFVKIIGEKLFYEIYFNDFIHFDEPEYAITFIHRMHEISPYTFRKLMCLEASIRWARGTSIAGNPVLINLLSYSVDGPYILLQMHRHGFITPEMNGVKRLTINLSDLMTERKNYYSQGITPEELVDFIKSASNLKLIQFKPCTMDEFSKSLSTLACFKDEEFAKIKILMDPFAPGMGPLIKDTFNYVADIWDPVVDQFHVWKKLRNEVNREVISEWISFAIRGSCSLKTLADISEWLLQHPIEPLKLPKKENKVKNGSLIKLTSHDEDDQFTNKSVHHAVLLACSSVFAKSQLFPSTEKDSNFKIKASSMAIHRTLLQMYHEDPFAGIDSLGDVDALNKLCELFHIAQYLGMNTSWKNKLENLLIRHIKKLEETELDESDLKLLNEFCEMYRNDLVHFSSYLVEYAQASILKT